MLLTNRRARQCATAAATRPACASVAVRCNNLRHRTLAQLNFFRKAFCQTHIRKYYLQ
jgi:hypothetical protein